MDQEMGFGIYTLLCIKQITNDAKHRNSTQGSVVT